MMYHSAWCKSHVSTTCCYPDRRCCWLWLWSHVWWQGYARSSSPLISSLFIPVLVLLTVLDLQSYLCGREQWRLKNCYGCILFPPSSNNPEFYWEIVHLPFLGTFLKCAFISTSHTGLICSFWFPKPCDGVQDRWNYNQWKVSFSWCVAFSVEGFFLSKKFTQENSHQKKQCIEWSTQK